MNKEMDRVYENGNNTKEISFFVGKEVEKTKFYGETTLFVVGNQLTQEIEKHLENIDLGRIEHIYFAANHSYDTFNRFDQIQRFLDKGYNVTYEVTNQKLLDVQHMLPNHKNFIIMLSVVIPQANYFKNNVVVKIDDSDVNRKNDGVYCIALPKIMTKFNLTTWQQYSGDKILD